MSDLDLLMWGSVGGIVAYLLVFVLPAINRVLEAERISKTRTGTAVMLYLCTLIIYVVIGAASAFFVDPQDSRGAFTAGVTGEGLLKGISAGSKSIAAIGRKITG